MAVESGWQSTDDTALNDLSLTYCTGGKRPYALITRLGYKDFATLNQPIHNASCVFLYLWKTELTEKCRPLSFFGRPSKSNTLCFALRPPYIGSGFGIDETPLAVGVAPASHAMRCRAGVHDHRSGDALHMLDLRQVTAGLLGAR